MGLQLAVRGLATAIAAITPDDPEMAEVRTGEAVFWADVASETIDPGAQHHLSPALTMVRNAVAHGAVACVGISQGLTWPLTWPLRWTDVIWAPAEQITTALGTPPSATRLRLYTERLEGQSVTDALTAVLTHYQRAL